MFNLHKVDNTAVCAPTTKQITANTEVAYKVGDALVITSGKAAKATGTTKPTHMCVETATGADEISAYIIEPNQEYEVPLSAVGTSLKVGDKVTIHTDAAQVTATTTSGVAEIVAINGTAVGDTVIVRF